MSKKIRLTDGTKLTLEELAAPDRGVPGNPRVMTLLREKKLNPEDVPEELLRLTDNSGMSVLDLCIERFQEPVMDEDEKYVPRALRLVYHNNICCLPLYFRMIKEIISIADKDGWSVAHRLAARGDLSESMMTDEILKLRDREGYLVAHWLASHKNLPESKMTKEILKSKSKNGTSVASEVAFTKKLPEWAKHDKDILMLSDEKRSYVAHILARNNMLPFAMMTSQILQLKDKNNKTVLYFLIKNRALTSKILLLPWNAETLVYEYIQSKFQMDLEEEDFNYIIEEFSKLAVVSSLSELLPKKNETTNTVEIDR